MSDYMVEEELIQEPAPSLTKNDRFAAVLVIALAIGGVLLGLLIRQRDQGRTWLYVNQQAGIQASYPAGWLVDESGSYLVRIRDPRARPFKTQYQITIIPVGSQSTIRNILDSLTLQRSIDLSAYRVLSVDEVSRGGTNLTRMSFAFVDADPNPFIQRLPVVVLGTDTVILDGNRAIVVTYMAEQSSFQTNQPAFDRFLASLQY
jgi:hypothetical protein